MNFPAYFEIQADDTKRAMNFYGKTYVCSMEVEDFDAIANTILKLDGQVALPKFAVPKMCWQGYFLDTEGNTFGIFQVDAEAA